jgi:hypothetical protein
LHDGIIAARQRPAGLAGSTQQPLDFRRKQSLGARAPRRPRKLQFGGHVGAQFASVVRPAAEAAQRFKLAIDAGRFHRPLAAQVLAEVGEIAGRQFFDRVAIIPGGKQA